MLTDRVYSQLQYSSLVSVEHDNVYSVLVVVVVVVFASVATDCGHVMCSKRKRKWRQKRSRCRIGRLTASRHLYRHSDQ